MFSCGTDDALSDTATPSPLRVTGRAASFPCLRKGDSEDQVPSGSLPRGCASSGSDARLALSHVASSQKLSPVGS